MLLPIPELSGVYFVCFLNGARNRNTQQTARQQQYITVQNGDVCLWESDKMFALSTRRARASVYTRWVFIIFAFGIHRIPQGIARGYSPLGLGMGSRWENLWTIITREADVQLEQASAKVVKHFAFSFLWLHVVNNRCTSNTYRKRFNLPSFGG